MSPLCAHLQLFCVECHPIKAIVWKSFHFHLLGHSRLATLTPFAIALINAACASFINASIDWFCVISRAWSRCVATVWNTKINYAGLSMCEKVFSFHLVLLFCPLGDFIVRHLRKQYVAHMECGTRRSKHCLLSAIWILMKWNFFFCCIDFCVAEWILPLRLYVIWFR